MACQGCPDPRPDAAARLARLERPACRHAGAFTGETRPCAACNRTVDVPLLACARHALRTEKTLVPGVACCKICPDYEARA